MGLNIKKLREFQPELERQAQIEREEEVIQYLLSDSYDTLQNNRFHSEIELSPRVLTHWKQTGIIPEKSIGKRKKEYNRTELVWLNLVAGLRQLGLPIEHIKNLKKSILDKNENTEFSIFEYAMINSIVVEPMILVIEAETGTPKVLSKSQYGEMIAESNVPMHIHINLMELAKQEYPNNTFDKTHLSSELKFSEDYINLMYFLKTGDYSEIKIRMDDGGIYLMEGSTKHNPNTKIIDIINSCKYQTIEIQVAGGKVVSIKNREKKKTV